MTRKALPILCLAAALPIVPAANAETVVAEFHAATDVPVVADGYTATGNSVSLSLAYAPTAGTRLTVVDNTGSGFIEGAFDNLAHGQTVALDHAGVTYQFVASYFGGTGNDLVLEWAATRLLAWGANSSGQLGTGTTTGSTTPAAVSSAGVLAGRTVVAMAAGEAHSLALCADGTLAAWGENNSGQLGIGSTTDSLVPVAVDTSGALAGRTVVAVAAGENHSLVLCSDGSVAVWGANFEGQLGDGTTANRNAPVAVAATGALAGRIVVQVAAGERHSLALCADGTVATWGLNSYGQLGDGTTSNRTVPVVVAATGALAGRSVRAVAAGQFHSLALCADGTIAAWGYNYYGQLGDGTTSSRSTPVAVNRNAGASFLSGRAVTSVTAGGNHSLALCSDGTVAAWGLNSSGQLGTGHTSNASLPTAADLIGTLVGKSFAGLGGGLSSSLAVFTDGSAAGWGANSSGQLGNGSTTSSNSPAAASTAALAPGERFVRVASGPLANHSLGLVATPPPPQMAVALADGTGLTSGVGTVNFATPFQGAATDRAFVLENLRGGPLTVTAVTFAGTDAGEFHLVSMPGTPLAAGSTATLVVAFAPAAASTRAAEMHILTNDPLVSPFVVNLAGAGGGPVVLQADYATGDEVPLRTSRFTATGNTLDLSLGFHPPRGSTLTVVDNTGLGFIEGGFAGLTHGQPVVLSHAGTDYEFVANYYGGSGNDLVLQWAGTTAAAWGANSQGQLGDGTTSSHSVAMPVKSGALAGKTVIALAAGDDHSLAVCADGTIAAWGDNSYGQLGDGTTTDRRAPVAVAMGGVLAGKMVVAAAAGNDFSVALCSDGTLATWGYGSSGRLGNGSSTSVSTPVAVTTTGVLAGKQVIAVAAGYGHSLAMCADGTLAAWGYNSDGQLGVGSTSTNSVPVAVSTASGSALAGKTVVAVAAGTYHSVALCADGTLAAWGDNDYGQLGTGDFDDRRLPALVDAGATLAGRSVTAIACGNHHSLARCADGTAAAWGYNWNGQLGDGTTVSRPLPVAIQMTGALAGRSIAALAAGDAHSISRCTDGSFVGWGYNSYGQLGDGTTTTPADPVTLSHANLVPGTRLLAAAGGAGADFTLGLIAEPPAPRIAVEQPAGTDLADGYDTIDFGTAQIGSAVSRSFLIRNTGGLGLVNIALTIDGANPGDFTVTTQPSAILAPGASSSFEVTFSPRGIAGRKATLHVTSSDPVTPSFEVKLAGMGSGALEAVYLTGVDVPLRAAGFTATGNTVNFALGHTPAAGATLMVVDNTGSNFIQGTFGNLAQGQRLDLPFEDGVYPFVADYFGGTGNDLVLRWAECAAWAWGDNSGGQLGNQSTVAANAPGPVTLVAGVLAGRTVVAVAGGASHSLALCSDGKLAAWGANNHGQLGNNSTTPRTLPVAVVATGALAGKTPIAIGCGAHHCLVLCSDGTMVAWGRGAEGQLGNNTTTDRNVPTAVAVPAGVLAGKTVVKIACGANHNLALCSDGTLAAWGSNSSGQLGDNTTTQRNVPVLVDRTSFASALIYHTVASITAGESHSLVWCTDDSLVAWGSNGHGQLGYYSSSPQLLPVEVFSGWRLHYSQALTTIAAGATHSLALVSDGELLACGRNSDGQLGDGQVYSARNSFEPVDASAGSSALHGKSPLATSAGSAHSLALCADGTAVAWGSNTSGQLGTGGGPGRSLPTLVATGTLPPGGRFVALAGGPAANHTLAIVARSLAPGIAVEDQDGATLTDEGGVDFGQLAVGSGSARSFTIRNTGTARLDGLLVFTEGDHAGEFVVDPPAAVSLLPGAATTFTVTFTPAGNALRQAALRIISNVAGPANPFDLHLIGRGPSHLEQWRLTWFGTTSNSGDAADDATPQNDGLTNLMKFATGIDPDRPGVLTTPLGRAGDQLTFTYPRSKAAVADGVVYQVEWTDTLGPATWSPNDVIETAEDLGATEQVTASLPAGPGPARFVRLKVTGP